MKDDGVDILLLEATGDGIQPAALIQVGGQKGPQVCLQSHVFSWKTLIWSSPNIVWERCDIFPGWWRRRFYIHAAIPGWAWTIGSNDWLATISVPEVSIDHKGISSSSAFMALWYSRRYTFNSDQESLSGYSMTVTCQVAWQWSIDLFQARFTMQLLLLEDLWIVLLERYAVVAIRVLF